MTKDEVEKFADDYKTALGDDFQSIINKMLDIVETRIKNRGDVKDHMIFILAKKGGLADEMSKLTEKYFTADEVRQIMKEGVTFKDQI